MYRKRDFYRKLLDHCVLDFQPSGNVLRRVAINTAKFSVPSSPKFFALKIAKLSVTCADQNTRRVGDFLGYSRILCDYSALSSFTDAEFEGKTYKILAG